MASTDKTPNLNLNKWLGGDNPKRADFNADNDIIDELFDEATGHQHNGQPGEGRKLAAENILIADAGGLFTAQDVEAALAEIQPGAKLGADALTITAPVNVLANKTYLRAALESITNNRKAAQLPKVTITGSRVENFLGPGANCETVNPWVNSFTTSALDTANRVFGTNSLKLTLNGAAQGSGSLIATVPNMVATDKYLALVAYIKNGNCAVGAKLRAICTGDATVAGANIADATKFTKTWVKLQPSDYNAATDVRANIYLDGANGQYAYVDGVMLTEISAADYADANYEPPDFVEGMQFLRNPAIRSCGKNLLPSLDKWVIHTNAKIRGAYSLELVATANYNDTYYDVACKPGTSYTVSATHNGTLFIRTLDAMGQQIVQTQTNGGSLTRVAEANAAILRVYLSNGTAGAGTFTFTDFQLEEGGAATAFEASRNELVVFPVVLDADETLTYENGRAFVTKKWEKNLEISGAEFPWAFISDMAGFKQLGFDPRQRLPMYESDGPTGRNSFKGYKYDGKPLYNTTGSGGLTAGDMTYPYEALTYITVSVADTDSGWEETWAGTTLLKSTYTALNRDATAADLIKAYFNGWKWSGGTGLWTSLVDGTTTSTNVDYVATVPAPNYTPYKITYILEYPVVYEVEPIGRITLAEGINQLEFLSGLVIGEEVNPVYNAGDTSWYVNMDSVSQRSRLKNKAKAIRSIYKNGEPAGGWATGISTTQAYGLQYALASLNYFENTAEYTADYELCHELYNSQKMTVTVADTGVLRDAANKLITAAPLIRKVPQNKEQPFIILQQSALVPADSASWFYPIFDKLMKGDIRLWDLTNKAYVKIQQPGLYEFEAYVAWATNATGYRAAYISIGGGETVADDVRTAVNGEYTIHSLVGRAYVKANETISIPVLQNSGSQINIAFARLSVRRVKKYE